MRALPGLDRRQVRHDEDRHGAEARRRGRAARAGCAARARRRPRRHDRVVQQASGRDLPVGQGRTRRRQGADGPQQHRRHRGREGGRTAARPHPRGLLRDDREGVQLAVEDRSDRRSAQRGARLRVLVAGGDADHRRGRRPAGGGAQARGRHREARGRHRGQGPEAQWQHGRDRGRLSGHLRLRTRGRPLAAADRARHEVPRGADRRVPEGVRRRALRREDRRARRRRARLVRGRRAHQGRDQARPAVLEARRHQAGPRRVHPRRRPRL